MTLLRLVTWNVHAFVGRDGIRDVTRSTDVLRDIQPDIVGLQEVDCRDALPGGTDRLERMASLTGLYPTFGPTVHAPHGLYGNALLTRWPAENVTYRDLSIQSREPRGVLGADVRVGDTPLRVIVTHFGLKAVERRIQFRRVLELVDLGSELPVVVMGDFNEWRPRARSMARFDATLGRAPRVRSFPSRFPILALDRIWVRPRRLLVELSAHHGSAARAASDHLPITAVIDLDG